MSELAEKVALSIDRLKFYEGLQQTDDASVRGFRLVRETRGG